MASRPNTKPKPRFRSRNRPGHPPQWPAARCDRFGKDLFGSSALTWYRCSGGPGRHLPGGEICTFPHWGTAPRFAKPILKLADEGC